MAENLHSQRTSRSARADHVRQKRAKRFANPIAAARKPKKSKRGQLKSSAYMPPVIARADLEGMSSRTGKRGQPRRRFDLALSIPGAELRLPSLPIARPGWRLISGTMAALLLFVLYSMWFSPTFVVDVVEVTGLERLTLTDITMVIGVSGESIIAVDPEFVQQSVMAAFPDLASVEVLVALPAKVQIKVIERQPLVSWIKDGRENWIDDQGVVFPTRGDAGPLVWLETEQLPFLAQAMDAKTQPSIDPGLVKQIVALGAIVPEGMPVLYDRQYGFGWDDLRGWSVYFGKEAGDFEMKLQVYQALVDRLENEGTTPGMISVEYLHAPFYRLER